MIEMLTKTFGDWTVLSEAIARGSDDRWLCRCKCGAEKALFGYSLRSGATTHCLRCRPSRLSDLSGKKFGRLLVCGFAYKAGTQSKAYWHCSCDCGKATITQGAALKSGTVQSCGCLKTERLIERSKTHGQASFYTGKRSRTYTIWLGLRDRCHRIANANWDGYGGRGITVCERWDSYEAFLEDAGECPSNKHSIDRYPNQNGNYEPGNVRWATSKEQMRNTRRNRLVTIDGVTRCLSEWIEVLELNHHTIFTRIYFGHEDPAEALTRPIKSRRRCCRKADPATSEPEH